MLPKGGTHEAIQKQKLKIRIIEAQLSREWGSLK